MGLTSEEVLAISEKFTRDSIAGAGAIAGKPCQIQSITEITGGNRVTFLWVDDDNVEHTSIMDVMDGEKGDTGAQGAQGIGISSMQVNASHHLIITYTNGTTQDAGMIPSGTIVDDALSLSSTNPVQNKVITEELNTKADLDNGKVPQSQLPSYVDDVVDGYYKEADGKFYKESTYETEITGESGKIYISVDTEIQYRWTGSAFSALGGALALGETSSTAYRGDRGKIAYDDSQTNKANIGTLANLETTEKGSLVGAINELKNESGGGSGLINWSESEQVAGTWIDGSTVYRKVLTKFIGSASGVCSDNIPIGTPISWGIVESGYWKTDDINVPLNVPSSISFLRCAAYIYTNSATSNPNTVRVETYKGSSSYAGGYVWISVLYTKATS